MWLLQRFKKFDPRTMHGLQNLYKISTKSFFTWNMSSPIRLARLRTAYFIHYLGIVSCHLLPETLNLKPFFLSFQIWPFWVDVKSKLTYWGLKFSSSTCVGYGPKLLRYTFWSLLPSHKSTNKVGKKPVISRAIPPVLGAIAPATNFIRPFIGVP